MTPSSTDLIRLTIDALEREDAANRNALHVAQRECARIEAIRLPIVSKIQTLRSLLPPVLFEVPMPDAMPIGWTPADWHHAPRRVPGGGRLTPEQIREPLRKRPARLRPDGSEERLYPGNGYTTQAKRAGIGTLVRGGGVWLTVPECWRMIPAKSVDATAVRA